MEQTYIMVKPHFANYDAIIKLVKQEAQNIGMKITQEKYVKYSKTDAQKHYAEHFQGSYENSKPFYPALEKYITSDKAYGMVMEGEDAIVKMRALIKRLRLEIPAMIGEEPRTRENVLHGSDCAESAQKEIAIFKSLQKLNVNELQK